MPEAGGFPKHAGDPLLAGRFPLPSPARQTHNITGLPVDRGRRWATSPAPIMFRASFGEVAGSVHGVFCRTLLGAFLEGEVGPAMIAPVFAVAEQDLALPLVHHDHRPGGRGAAVYGEGRSGMMNPRAAPDPLDAVVETGVATGRLAAPALLRRPA
jgi:hypothetical protein